MEKIYELSPSILSADFAKLAEQVQAAEKAGAKWLHIDVMDGSFVPPVSYGDVVVKCLRPYTETFFDVHLMVEEPYRYIADYKAAGAAMFTVHAEACRHLDRTLQAIREAGLMAGVALNPATPLSVLDYVLDKVDMVLIMSVNPGYGGQKYIPAATQKIRDLKKKLVEAGYPDILIEVDGGVNMATIDEVLDAGVNIVVAGSAVFKGDIAANVQALQAKLDSRR